MNTQYYRSSHGQRRVPIIIAILVGLVLIGILLFSLIRREDNIRATSVGAVVPVAVLKNLTTISPHTWQRLGTDQATPAEKLLHSSTTATVLYIGAEGCPFCAAERWPLIVALSRFGHFRGLTLMRSNSEDQHPDTPTFSFFHATYQSPYIHVALMETAGRQLGPNGFYPPLMALSKTQSETFHLYDRPPYVPKGYAGAIPFLLIGHRYLWIGSSVNPALLDQHNWVGLSQAVYSGIGQVGKSILVNANALTSAICATDGGHPRSVCRLLNHFPLPTVAVS